MAGLSCRAVATSSDRVDEILRLARHFDRELAPVYRGKGLDFGLFDVLATLRRIGPPYRLTRGELDDWCIVTSGGMTARLQRLEEAGLVARGQDANDGRVVRVELSLPQALSSRRRCLARKDVDEDQRAVHAR